MKCKQPQDFSCGCFCGESPLTIVIPTKRSAWGDLRTIVKNTIKSVSRSLDCARDDSSVKEPTASQTMGSGQIHTRITVNYPLSTQPSTVPSGLNRGSFSR